MPARHAFDMSVEERHVYRSRRRRVLRIPLAIARSADAPPRCCRRAPPPFQMFQPIPSKKNTVAAERRMLLDFLPGANLIPAGSELRAAAHRDGCLLEGVGRLGIWKIRVEPRRPVDPIRIIHHRPRREQVRLPAIGIRQTNIPSARRFADRSPPDRPAPNSATAHPPPWSWAWADSSARSAQSPTRHRSDSTAHQHVVAPEDRGQDRALGFERVFEPGLHQLAEIGSALHLPRCRRALLAPAAECRSAPR